MIVFFVVGTKLVPLPLPLPIPIPLKWVISIVFHITKLFDLLNVFFILFCSQLTRLTHHEPTVVLPPPAPAYSSYGGGGAYSEPYYHSGDGGDYDDSYASASYNRAIAVVPPSQA